MEVIRVKRGIKRGIKVKNVLILEDDRESSRLLSDLLSECREELAIFTAYDEKEAMQMAMDCYMDMFIIDILLHEGEENDISGLIFTKKIRQVSQYEITPIIFITSIANLELHSYREISCFSYILKPLNPSKQKQLINEVEKLFKGSSRSPEEEYYYFKVDYVYYPVRIDDLVLVRCEGRKLMVQTVKETFYVSRLSMKRLKEDLQKMGNYSLVECRRGVLVNQNHIENIDTVAHYLKLRNVDELIDFGNSKWLSHVKEVIRFD